MTWLGRVWGWVWGIIGSEWCSPEKKKEEAQTQRDVSGWRHCRRGRAPQQLVTSTFLLEEGQDLWGLLRQWHLFCRSFKEQPGLPSLWSGGAYSSGSGHTQTVAASLWLLPEPPGGFSLSHASAFDTNTSSALLVPQLPLSLTRGGPSFWDLTSGHLGHITWVRLSQ